LKQGEGDEIDYIVGPIRVLPGRLSVSRTFGDPEAKLEYKNGNPKVVIADPEIKVFQITKQHDYIILACDGIFDKMSNTDVNSCVWNSC
jgi:protein phosphatase 2C family protein 2/3